MKKQTLFDPAKSLIIIQVEVWGPLGGRQATLALDTGASETMLTPGLIDDIGYSARDGIQRTSVTSAIGREYGYLLRLQKFSALGFDFDNYAVNVLDLPENSGIDGLLGLSFLRQLVLELRAKEGIIWAEPAL